jgi:superfamily II DNA/RNA helicase
MDGPAAFFVAELRKRKMSFDTLGLHEALTKAVADSGYDSATEVQQQAIPPALQGRDLMVSASTGSGKTASFILPALQRILAARGDNTKRREKGIVYGPRILVLTPTRELAMQVPRPPTPTAATCKACASLPSSAACRTRRRSRRCAARWTS